MKIGPSNNSATFFEEEYVERGDCDPTTIGIIAGTAETGEGTLYEARNGALAQKIQLLSSPPQRRVSGIECQRLPRVKPSRRL